MNKSTISLKNRGCREKRIYIFNTLFKTPSASSSFIHSYIPMLKASVESYHHVVSCYGKITLNAIYIWGNLEKSLKQYRVESPWKFDFWKESSLWNIIINSLQEYIFFSRIYNICIASEIVKLPMFSRWCLSLKSLQFVYLFCIWIMIYLNNDIFL